MLSGKYDSQLHILTVAIKRARETSMGVWLTMYKWVSRNWIIQRPNMMGQKVQALLPESSPAQKEKSQDQPFSSYQEGSLSKYGQR